MLHPADVYVLAGLVSFEERSWTFRELAGWLGVPHASVQRALGRAEVAGLYEGGLRRVQRPNLEEFLVHAVRFVAPVRLGELVAGVPAAWAAEPVKRRIRESGELPPVWPAAGGSVRGQAFAPLHPAAVEASAASPALGELLAVVDCLRGGDVRVRSVAAGLLAERLRAPAVHG